MIHFILAFELESMEALRLSLHRGLIISSPDVPRFDPRRHPDDNQT